MKKIKTKIKEKKMAIIPLLSVVLVGILLLAILYPKIKTIKIKEVENKEYKIQYDNTWKKIKEEENAITLKHKSGSKCHIEITPLTEEYTYQSIKELIEELRYTIQEENKEFELISEKEAKLTKEHYDGYKLLLENEKEQVMMAIFKKGDKLITLEYQAKNDYFDILLDSVESLLESLEIKQENYSLKNKLKLKTQELTYEENKTVDKALKKNQNYEIAYENYWVKYSIPGNFTEKGKDTTTGSYEWTKDVDKITIRTSVWNRNIYEYLDQDSSLNIYKNFQSLKDNKDYKDFEEQLSKIDSKKDIYLYKNSYIYKNAVKYDKNFKKQTYDRKMANAEYIYALDNSHIFIVQIESAGFPITEKLLEEIKVVDDKNYSSYVKREKKDGFLIGTFINKKNSSKQEEKIILKLPEKYEEVDKKTNLYLAKNYAINYDEEEDLYDYEVHYEWTTLKKDFIISNLNSSKIKKSYGSYQDLTQAQDLTVNDKKFTVYNGGYTDMSGIMFTNIDREKYYVSKKVLFYEIPTGGIFFIEISGNGKEITNEMIQELTNFSMELEK